MTDPANAARARHARRWWVAVGCAVLAVCAIWFLVSNSTSGTAAVLKDRSAFENQVSRAMNMLPAGLRSFLRKVKVKLVGPAKLVLLDVFVVHFPAPPSIPTAKELDLRGRDANLRVLVVPATNSDRFRDILGQIKGSRVLSSRQMSAFSGQSGQLSTFANPSPGIYEGHTVEVLPRARQGGIDVAIYAEALSPVMADSGAMTATATNLLATVRVNLEPGTGVLILPGMSSGSSTGVFVLPTIFRLKR